MELSIKITWDKSEKKAQPLVGFSHLSFFDPALRACVRVGTVQTK